MEISPIPLFHLILPIPHLPIHSSIELNEEGGGAVPPLGVVRHLRAAHRARPLPVEPRYLKEGRKVQSPLVGIKSNSFRELR